MTHHNEQAGTTCTASPGTPAYIWGKLADCNWAIVRHRCPDVSLPTTDVLPDPPTGGPPPHCPGFGLLRVLAGPDDGLDIPAEWRHTVSSVTPEYRPAFAHGLLAGAREGLRLPPGWRGL